MAKQTKTTTAAAFIGTDGNTYKMTRGKAFKNGKPCKVAALIEQREAVKNAEREQRKAEREAVKAAKRDLRAFLATAPIADAVAFLDRNGIKYTFSGICFWLTTAEDAAVCGLNPAHPVASGRHAGQWYIRRKTA